MLSRKRKGHPLPLSIQSILIIRISQHDTTSLQSPGAVQAEFEPLLSVKEQDSLAKRLTCNLWAKCIPDGTFTQEFFTLHSLFKTHRPESCGGKEKAGEGRRYRTVE